MNKLQRYMLWELSKTTLFTIIVLTSVMWLVQSLRFIDLVINQALPLITIFKFLSLLLPFLLYHLLPLGGFISIFYTYQKLSQERELIAMRSSGLSPLQLSLPAFLVAGIMTFIGYTISLYFLPQSTSLFKTMQYELSTSLSASLLRENQFNIIGPGLTIFIKKRLNNKDFKGIVIQDDRNPQHKTTYVAETGRFNVYPENITLTLLNGSHQEIDIENPEKSQGLKRLQFDSYTHEIEMKRNPNARKQRSAEERTVPELLDPQDVSPDDKLYRKLLVSGHQRLSSPLYIFAFVLLGLTILFYGNYNRRGNGMRILFIAFVVALLEGLSIGLKNIASHYPPLIPMLYALPIIPILFGTFMIARGRMG
ncbi:MAG: LptF/LptG family permease [Alphaproteobacteria bacterium]|nr:LptF/LptG family permease [Alphaproteobacteria bacterium]